MKIQGKSILVIDDDAAMLRALRKVLSGEGAVVTSACWAGEAMEYLTDRLEHFDLIITDLRMPILEGQTILRAVSVALPGVPVIVITAFGNPEIKAECMHWGAAAFLEKPLDTQQLIGAIELAFSSSKPASSRIAHRRRGARKTEASEGEGDAEPFDPMGGVPHGMGS